MNTLIRSCTLCIVLLACIFSVGCATTIRGTKDTIPVTSAPSGAKVYRDNNEFVGLTPCQVVLWRNKEHRIAVVNDEGTKVFVATAKPRVKGWSVVGSVFFVGSGFPGLVGLPIDAASGANAKLNINHVFADFDKMEENFTVLEMAQVATNTPSLRTNVVVRPSAPKNLRVVNPPAGSIVLTNHTTNHPIVHREK